jgi:hypothetical protein
MSTRALLFQWANSLKIQQSSLSNAKRTSSSHRMYLVFTMIQCIAEIRYYLLCECTGRHVAPRERIIL